MFSFLVCNSHMVSVATILGGTQFKNIPKISENSITQLH